MIGFCLGAFCLFLFGVFLLVLFFVFRFFFFSVVFKRELVILHIIKLFIGFVELFTTEHIFWF